MFDIIRHFHYDSSPSPDLRACRIGIEDCIARLIRMETSMSVNSELVKAALASVTAGVAEETSLLTAFDSTLDNIATEIADLKAKVESNSGVPQDIVDSVTALQLALGQNRDHIVNLAAKGTSLAGQAPADPGANTEVPQTGANPTPNAGG